MRYNASQTEIDKHTLEETSQTMTDAFPFRSDCTDLSVYPGKKFPWHWHNEVEILLIESGKLNFLTTSRSLGLSKGDIVFFAGGMLHCTHAYAHVPAVHKEFIFSPMLIAGAPGSEIGRKYVSPVLRACNGPIYLPAGTSDNISASCLLQ